MSDRSGNGPASRGPNKTMLRRTLFLLAVCGIVAFLVLGIKLYDIMIVKHDIYESEAIAQQMRETTISPSRGTIYDRNGKILAMSAGVSTVVVVPAEIVRSEDDPMLIASGLSEILGVDYAKILDMTAKTSSWYQVVARKVEDDKADLIRAFKSENKIAGIRIEPDYKRYYPYGSLGAHIIGFVGVDNDGLAGIEARYNSMLSGAAGRVMRTTNAAGTDILYMNYEDFLDADNGYDLTLTLDAAVQFSIEKHLKQAVVDYEIQDGAAAIVMEVDTGAILSMVSLGNFDLNNYQALSEEAEAYIQEKAQTDAQADAWRRDAQFLQWRNKALSDTYEPGSTFKILTLAMALNESVVSENDSFYCGGSITVTGDDPGFTGRKCWKTTGHGSQTLTAAVQHSCNVAFIQIGLKVGAEKFYEYAEGFGLLTLPQNKDARPSAVTGIDLAGESGSFWWPENEFTAPYNKTSLAAASFGQTFNITPLQLITAVSACVNGGRLMKPYVVEQVRDSEGNIVSDTEPTVVRRVISEDTSAMVCQILEQVVGDFAEGTGKNAYVAGYRIGGKTGTSTKTVKELSGVMEYIVSFIGVAPADDPKIAVLVLLDNPVQPSKIYTSGGQMAAPVVGRMMADILPHLGVEAQYSETELANMDRAMPNVIGLSVEEAQRALTDSGFMGRVIGSGETVTKQLPAANQIIASGSEVIIYADAEPSEDLEEMLDLADLTYSIARQRLSYYGIFIRSDSSVTNAETQMISAQSIAEGEKVEHGTVVEVTLIAGGDAMLGRY